MQNGWGAAELGGLGRRFALAGEVALVTGAASGIGCAAAEALAAAGAAVAVADLEGEAAEAVAERLQAAGARALARRMDVADEASVADAVAAVLSDWGRIDVLVNSAGIARREPSESLSLADWNRVIGVNLTGLFLCCRTAARPMLERGRGRIVNIASIMGLVGNPLYPNLAYHASKGGVVALTRALAVEWAPRGVRVNAIAPTFVRTPLTEGLLADPAMAAAIEGLTPLGRIAEAADIEGAVLYLASEASAMVTGHVLAVDGGWLAR